jgi:hypothetical protein
MRTGEIVDNKMDAETEKAIAAFGAASGSTARQPRHTKCDHGMYEDMCDICKPAPSELVARMNKAEDCILYLRIQRLMTDGETERIRRKINQRLIDASQSEKAKP